MKQFDAKSNLSKIAICQVLLYEWRRNSFWTLASEKSFNIFPLFSGCSMVWHWPLEYAPVSKTWYIGLKKCYLSDIFVPKVKRLKLNFSKEKSKFALIMLLYRFFLLPVLVSICAKYFENFPEIHLYFLEILFSEISEY